MPFIISLPVFFQISIWLFFSSHIYKLQAIQIGVQYNNISYHKTSRSGYAVRDDPKTMVNSSG